MKTRRIPPFRFQTLERLMERSLRFRYQTGALDHTPVPHITGPRVMPIAVFTLSLNRSMHCELEEEKLTSGPGEGFLIPAGVRHTFRAPEGAPLQSAWFHGQFTMLGSVDLLSLFECPRLCTGTLASSGESLCRKLIELEEQPADDPVRLAVRRQQLGLAFLDLVLSHSYPKPHFENFLTHADRLEPALALVQNELGTPITLQRMARSVGLSRSRFHEVFAETMGMTPMAFVLQKRLERAQQLLMGSDHPVKEISENVGFGDPFHFSRIFKKNIGVSPMQFRQQRRQAVREGLQA